MGGISGIEPLSGFATHPGRPYRTLVAYTRTLMDFATARRDSLVRYLRQHVSGEVRFDDVAPRLVTPAPTPATTRSSTLLGVVLPKEWSTT